MWIRILAVGVIGLVGMGAVAALGRNPAPEPRADDYPVAETAGKADRLPLIAEQETVMSAVKVPPAQPASPPLPASIALVSPPSPQVAKPEPAPPIIPRHWHDPTDPKLKSRKQAVTGKQYQTLQDEGPRRTVEAKNCSGNGLDSLLQSIRLKPRCE